MPIDYSISRWVRVVPARQWAREDEALEAAGAALPEIVLGSRALAEVHRLDLALFVIFEEAALRVSGALTRRAPTVDALGFAAQQTLDEARHHEMFRRRLDTARAAAGMGPAEALDAVLIPPLRAFIARCYEVADSGAFLEAMTLMNLLLEGMAYPLYAYEERYWQPVDPFLANLVRSAFNDETRRWARRWCDRSSRTTRSCEPAPRGCAPRRAGCSPRSSATTCASSSASSTPWRDASRRSSPARRSRRADASRTPPTRSRSP